MRKRLRKHIQDQLRKKGVCLTYRILGFEFVLDQSKTTKYLMAKNKRMPGLLYMNLSDSTKN